MINDKIKLRCDRGPFAGKCFLVPKKPIGHWYAIKVSENKFLIYSSRFSYNGPEHEILEFHNYNGKQHWNDFAPLSEVKRLEPTIVDFNGFTT